jgi:hypothetical protein
MEVPLKKSLLVPGSHELMIILKPYRSAIRFRCLFENVARGLIAVASDLHGLDLNQAATSTAGPL